MSLFRLRIPKVLWKYLYAIVSMAAVVGILRLPLDATTMLILVAFTLALLFLAIFVVTRRSGNSPRSGPQHPLPVTSPLETRKTKRSS